MEHHTCWPSHRVGLRPTFGPADLARLPGLLCLGSAELVLPCSLPCFALPRPPASLIREAALRAASAFGRRPPFVDSFMDGCGEAGEAQGILQGSFDENFSATSWESCATSSQLRSNFVTWFTHLYKRTGPKFCVEWRPDEILASHMRQVMANQVLGFWTLYPWIYHG